MCSLRQTQQKGFEVSRTKGQKAPPQCRRKKEGDLYTMPCVRKNRFRMKSRGVSKVCNFIVREHFECCNNNNNNRVRCILCNSEMTAMLTVLDGKN